MAWENVLKSRSAGRGGGSRSRDVQNELAYSTSAKGKTNMQACFTLGINIVKKLRLHFQDRMVICKDGDMGLIKRANGNDGNSRALSAPNKNNPTCGVIKFTLHPPFVQVPHLITLEHELTSEGIEFVWPKEGQTE